MIIAVDFDGTCVDHCFPEIGKDVPSAEEVIRGLIELGHDIILYTMRSGESLVPAVKWFKDKELFLSGINSNPGQSSWTQSPKVYANVYIDDAAFGCPLIQPAGFERACVDWNAVSDGFLILKTSSECM